LLVVLGENEILPLLARGLPLLLGLSLLAALAAECCIIRENIATFTHKMQIVRSSISNTTTCPAELSIRHQGISAEANF
jgi:hypothetical protein